jgi:polyisoprenoid-binding protein YceI
MTRKRNRTRNLGLFLLAGWILLGSWAEARAAVETYEIDPVHSSVMFKVRHLFTKVAGRFDDFSGILRWDPEDPTKSSVEVTIQAASIDTDNEKRDEHLKSKDFLAVQEYPTITFRSTKVEKVGENRFEVTGDLTIHGVTKPVTLEVEAMGFGPGPMGKYRGGFTATTKIDRTEFGVSWNMAVEGGGLVLGKQVEITLDIEVVRQEEDG